MEPHRDDNDLVAALRSLRPTPRQEFAAELDARAETGFPRDAQAPASILSRIAERFRTTPPRRMLAPAGALALAAVVIATTVLAVSEDSPTSSTTLLSDRSGPVAPQPAAPKPNESGEVASPSAGADRASSGVEYSVPPPSTYGAAPPRTSTLNFSGTAFQAGDRAVERSAQIVLGTDPERVRADASKVFDAVHAVDGIVLNSSIRDGAAGDAGAEFELLIPSGRLGDALADLSAIGEVRSRRESTQDITAPTVGARERLQDSEAKIEGLLTQLTGAETETERTAVEAKLRAERRQAAFFRSELDRLSRRANLSRVSLRIETGAAASGEDGGGAWGVEDGLDDAGRILEIAAGVTIVGLAILAPLALIAFLAWLAHRAWLRRARDRSLRHST